MPFEWNKEALTLAQAPDSLKILSTVDTKGCPHIVIDNTISVNEESELIYLELLETSRSNSNLTNSLWFKKAVTVHVKKGEKEYAIQGIPKYSIISGSVFEKYYREALANDPSADLSTVWVIQPTKIINESFEYKKAREKAEHPLVMHLDHLAKES